uniref:MIP18 family-like domain-containing protein n=1 Tax=Physcomitrium patens TaxID=3218 RepID=A0A2K1K8G8_PHYPA|nr:hypothetical protein PHYPA_011965 [Physcomitrium patens]
MTTSLAAAQLQRLPLEDIGATCKSKEVVVSFQLELSTPACPVKDMFEQQGKEKVSAIPWVNGVDVKITAKPAEPLIADDVLVGFKKVFNIVAASSCKVVPLTAAIIVTIPQKLAFIDVAKGVRIFSKLKVPCVAVVENMRFFEGDDKRNYSFGKGSGAQIFFIDISDVHVEVVQQLGIPHLFELPFGLEGSQVANTFSDIGVCVVQQCAKLRQAVSTAVTYNKAINALRVKAPGSTKEFLLHPATNKWSGEQKLRYTDVSKDIQPESSRPMGNYAVVINWPDGFSQIAPNDQLASMERLVDVPEPVSVLDNFRSTDSNLEIPVNDGVATILNRANSVATRLHS